LHLDRKKDGVVARAMVRAPRGAAGSTDLSPIVRAAIDAAQTVEFDVVPLSPLLSILLLAAAPPATAPEHFFVGRTEGAGTVQMILTGSHKVRDHSRGHVDKSGALILEQVVEEEGKPARRRSWRLVRAGGNRIAGTISDAVGPVSGEIAGSVLHLKYRAREGNAAVEQWITLHPNGRTASNRMVFRRFGIKAATLESTIRKLD
jgi:Protein of unknown function (DUF3833)